LLPFLELKIALLSPTLAIYTLFSIITTTIEQEPEESIPL